MPTDTDIARLRLHNQQVTAPADDAVAVVRHLGAVQAQDYGQALWAIGARTAQATAQSIEQAIARGTIVRTWPMRGTIHFVPAEDAKWMLGLSAERMVARDGRRLQQLELDYPTIERCAELFSSALGEAGPLPRSRLMEVLEQAGIGTQQQRGYHILWHLAQRGLLCIGPMQGKEPTFALLEQWAPRPRELDRQAALGELAARYVAGHGPATVHDFAWWAGLTVGQARAGIEAAGAGLDSEQRDGKIYWTARHAVGQAVGEAAGVYLLPGFDEYLLGYKDRSAVLDSEYATRVVPGNNGIFMPLLVVDGRIAGIWKRTRKKHAVDIVLQPFAPIDQLAPRAEQAAARYAAFLGLALGSLTVAG